MKRMEKHCKNCVNVKVSEFDEPCRSCKAISVNPAVFSNWEKHKVDTKTRGKRV